MRLRLWVGAGRYRIYQISKNPVDFYKRMQNMIDSGEVLPDQMDKDRKHAACVPQYSTVCTTCSVL